MDAVAWNQLPLKAGLEGFEDGTGTERDQTQEMPCPMPMPNVNGQKDQKNEYGRRPNLKFEQTQLHCVTVVDS